MATKPEGVPAIEPPVGCVKVDVTSANQTIVNAGSEAVVARGLICDADTSVAVQFLDGTAVTIVCAAKVQYTMFFTAILTTDGTTATSPTTGIKAFY